MRIAVLNIPFRAPWLGKEQWITVPPQGYGGIQWIVRNLIEGLMLVGHSVLLLGAPGSRKFHENMEVINIGEISDIERWLWDNRDKYDIVHDHTCRGEEFPPKMYWDLIPRIHSHYLSSLPFEKEFLAAASYAHAKSIDLPNVPVIRHPVNPDLYKFCSEKQDYLLYLGRISEWKGPDWAATFAAKTGRKLIMAGPSWEPDYLSSLKQRFGKTIDYIGEVGGEVRVRLISEAKATLVFSKSVPGPSGRVWVEPGATVVSESAISGTPVISSQNGCLAEIVPSVGVVINNPEMLSNQEAGDLLDTLPSPRTVYRSCYDQWHYIKIAKEYIQLYEKALSGERW